MEKNTLPVRDNAPQPPTWEIEYNYFMYLCGRVGLNGFPGNTEKMKRSKHEYTGKEGLGELQNFVISACKDDDIEKLSICKDDDQIGGTNCWDPIVHSKVTYFDLANKLYHTDFRSSVYMDANRAEDGETLRLWYAQLTSFYSDYKILEEKPCSVLEMLIAFAERIDRDVIGKDIDAPDRSAYWFWLMLGNLGLVGYRFCDALYNTEVDFLVGSILEVFLSRTYGRDGVGGLFPIKNESKVANEMELWAQMLAFFNENPQYY